MRELVLDTETTGLDYENGDRIVEIGIVELENHIQTGNNFHYYLNPERDSDPKAQQIHGLTREFLSDKPKFSEIADEFIKFLSDSKIIIHNAAFDMGFINAELKKCNIIEIDNSLVIDTLMLAKKKFVGQTASLDALCRRFNIDISNRETHGALKDAKLLSLVYLELIGGQQTKLNFNNGIDNLINDDDDLLIDIKEYYKGKKIIPKRNLNINEIDTKLHLESIKEISKSIWEKLKN
jgi:DNA polymerase-3 subunit epsilon